MAVLHLQFDIDSEVHPELHEMLCAIGSSRSQAERLRQLAATGLVWERLRLQSYGRFEVPDLGPHASPAAAAAVDASASFLQKATVPAAETLAQVDAVAVQGPELEGFVDLSDAVVLADLTDADLADADPAPVDVGLAAHDGGQHVVLAEATDLALLTAPAPAPVVLLPTVNVHEPLPLHEIRNAVRALPVLTEVVDTAELPNMQLDAAANEAAAGAGGGFVSSGAQIHELTPIYKTAPRSRLMRMKEKGLFKNE